MLMLSLLLTFIGEWKEKQKTKKELLHDLVYGINVYDFIIETYKDVWSTP